MNEEDIVKSLQDIFVDVLEHSSFELSKETTANDVDGWDSVTHMMLITEIENKHQIKFSLMDLMNLNNVGDLINVIKEKTKS
ncbi:acyl carrier protein [Flagellimonas sp. HMM57]|uniref:acyl carrier protein n=1 Tax=unclassified Flagellimonas TaxID=2644544 RepID=UPI0013D75F68|nr:MULTISPECIES: acyl carrier protein [unclassified Flagellimonas]UII76149.1 acyl carrier protein [Flagellimonas sp. HMM57]